MSSAAKVGMFMLVILAILGFFILKIEDVELGGKAMRDIKVKFDNVAGLNRQASVRVSGVDVGKVTDIEMDPRDGKALVSMEIREDVPLHANAFARVANLGLLGEKYVELNPGTPSAGPLVGETVVLPGTQPASIDDVTSQVSAIAADVKAITESLRTVMSGPRGQQRLEDIVENIRQVTGQMRDLIATNRVNVDATVSNMRAITSDLRTELPKLAASIDRVANQLGGAVGENRQDIRQIVENLRQLSSDLKLTTTNLNAITGQVKSGEGTVGKLIYDDEAHERLTAALGSVEGGVTALRDTLGRVGQVTMDLGIKADYYAGMKEAAEGFENLGGTSRTAVGIRLVPNPKRNRFYNVELSDDPRGQRRDKVTVQTLTNEQTGETTTTTLRETRFERDFLISGQVGWTFDNLALRVGLFDSAGGVGADYDIGDRVRVTGEAFDFGGKRDDNPHVRLFGEYTFRKEKEHSPRLFFTSGVDNPLNDLAVIFGGGIRWRDDDLKYLLGSIPLGR